jgi:hypothetical protein
MKFRVDWREYYDCEGPQTVRDLNDTTIEVSRLIGKRIIDITQDNYFGLIFEVEE